MTKRVKRHRAICKLCGKRITYKPLYEGQVMSYCNECAPRLIAQSN